MGLSPLPQAGVELVAKNADKATKQINVFTQAVNKVNTSVKNASSKITSSFQNVSKTISGKVSPAINKMTSDIANRTVPGLSALNIQITAATTAAIAATAAFIALGQRGAKIQETAQAFANVLGPAQNATGVLNSLRTQVRGTVSDFDLMQATVAALAGTSQDFRDVVGPNIGKVIDVTGRAATALGQSADVVREKFILGLRRQSKLLLDDIGVAVDAEKAYAAYAKEIGVATAALTDQQKQAAFAAEAIRQLDRISQEVGGIDSTTEKIRQMNTSFKNMRDRLAVAVLPLFDAFANIGRKLAKVLEEVANVISSVLGTAFKTAAAAVNLAVTFIEESINTILNFLRPIRPVILNLIAIFQLLGEAVQAVFGFIAETLRKIFGGVNKETDKGLEKTENKIQKFIENTAEALSYGGTYIILAFAKGMLAAGGFVVSAISAIAGIVASFLEGLSPPKEGPLKNIDTGGENVIKAWVSGMLGAVADPIDKVAAFVDERLGVIGKFSLAQVDARLAMLDAALAPFQQRVEIVKSDFQAITAAIDPATKILERQRKALLKQLEAGKAVDIERVRAIDAQLAGLSELEDQQQDAVDRAELQLQLAQGMQAQERALLNIRKQQLGEAEKASATASAAAAKAGGGAAAPAPGEAGGGLGAFQAGVAPDLAGGPSILEQTREKLRAAIGRGSERARADVGFDEALAGFNEKTGELDKNIDRIKNAKPGENIKKALAGIPDAISGIPDKIIETADKIASAFSTTITTGIETAKTTAATFRILVVGIWGVVEPKLKSLANFFSNTFTRAVNTVKDNVLLPFQNFMLGIWDLISPNLMLIVDFWNTTFSKALDNARTKYETLMNAIDNFWTWRLKPALQKIADFFTITIPGAIQATINKLADILVPDGLQTISDLLSGIVEAAGKTFDFGINLDISIPDWLENLGEAGVGIIKSGLEKFGLQQGSAWTGDGPLNEVAPFMVHRRESVIPAHGMRVANIPGVMIVPTPRGPILQAATGRGLRPAPMTAGTTNNSTVNNNNNQRSTVVNNTFSMNSRREALLMQNQQLAFLGRS